MRKLASSLPLQDMIRNVLDSATVKLAEDKGEKVQKLLQFERKEHGHIPSVKEEMQEKCASALDGDYIEKLASACDFIAANAHNIEPEAQGLLAGAMAKLAGHSGKGLPAAHGETEHNPSSSSGALTATKAMGGAQSHKKDKPKTEDAAASQASTPLSTAGLPGSKTQMENDMHSAPGQASGKKPTAKYPAKGPLAAISKTAGQVGALSTRDLLKQAMESEKKTETEDEDEEPEEKSKTAAEIAKEHILLKLAGEDVMKAKIDGGGTSSPLAGKGQLKSTKAGQSSPHQAGDHGSGFGNEARSHIATSSAAISATKKDLKAPVKPQLKQLLEEPALSKKTDSVITRSLRNTGSEKIAGVKTAADAARDTLTKIAAGGCTCGGQGECQYDLMKVALQKAKTANMMLGAGGAPGGGGMAMAAGAGASPDGCTCAGEGSCRVCRLKAALAKAQGPAEGGAPPPDAGGQPPTSMGPAGSGVY